MDQYRAVVIDNGTGFTKMGYAGNLDPDFIFPTAIAEYAKKANLVISTKNDEFNYYIGEEAIKVTSESKNHTLIYPMKDGCIESWELMEKYWHQSIYNYMKCDPQEHYFVLTEPPMNPPENRENIAEIFFETFNCPGIYIGVQAVLALVGCRATFDTDQAVGVSEDQKKAIQTLTGIVVDSGDGVTHVVPICDGYVVGSSIKHIPIAGRKITKFMETMIRERGEKDVQTEDLYLATMKIKEKYGYVAGDLLEEFSKYDKKDNKSGKIQQSKKFKMYEGIGEISKKPFKINLGYELFMGPEAFFSPEIIDKNWKAGLDETIDTTIQQCPIDYRRKLYANIVMSGGSTKFRKLDERLKSSIQTRVDERLKKNEVNGYKPKPINVAVTNSLAQKHVVWLGGSTIACDPGFSKVVHSRAEYEEKGPSCCRYNCAIAG